jgi:hypothetical protein
MLDVLLFEVCHPCTAVLLWHPVLCCVAIQSMGSCQTLQRASWCCAHCWMSTTSEAVQALLPSAEKTVHLRIRRLPGVRAYDAAVR